MAEYEMQMLEISEIMHDTSDCNIEAAQAMDFEDEATKELCQNLQQMDEFLDQYSESSED